MTKYFKNLDWIHTRKGFFTLLVVLTWVKSLFAYTMDFHLVLERNVQYLFLLFNPIASAVLLLAIGLYVRGKKSSYATFMGIYILLTTLLFSNAIYSREFADFISTQTILSFGAVNSGLGDSALQLLTFTDILYWADVVVLLVLLAKKKIKMEEQPTRGRVALATSAIGLALLGANFKLAEIDRPNLFQNTFSSNYVVRYLGIPAFLVRDAMNTIQVGQIRAQASPTDLHAVEEFVSNNFAQPNPDMFGVAEGRNVFVIHLESYQNFLLDFTLPDEEGVEHEVTPFINSMFHSNYSYSFDNIFHGTGVGRTSDAETIMENSLFGLPQGSVFTQFGGTNTFHAAPHILSQRLDYTTAVFHGNIGNFWNRNNVYRSFGLDFFIDSSYMNWTNENTMQFGMHDKYTFVDSIPYLERLQQPFYSKFITVSHHFPFTELPYYDEQPFLIPETNDATVNGFFATVNYMDRAIEEFFTYLKKVGLYENSLFVFYGDHNGISNMRNPSLAPLLDRDPETWNNYDNAMLQRVPVMFHMPGLTTTGGLSHTYGGLIDVLPTTLHLLGIDASEFIMFGQDLFSNYRNEISVFRNGNFVTPNYTVLSSDVFVTQTGEQLEVNDELYERIEKKREHVRTKLSLSDSVIQNDLLRFFTRNNLPPVDRNAISFQNAMEQMQAIEQELGENSTSLYSQFGGTTVHLYESAIFRDDEPEEE